MTPLLVTLFEGRYDHGVAALINSAISCGFPGNFRILHREKRLPQWTVHLKQIDQTAFEVGRHRIDFIHSDPPRHFGYQKPLALREALNTCPGNDTFIYADPDVFFLAPWTFFADWISRGVAYCLDSNFPYLPETHPWRAAWKELIAASIGNEIQPLSTYPNSGFISVNRCDAGFLDDWIALTTTFESQGGNTKSFTQKARYNPIVGDQDLMAAALMCWKGRHSALGPEGMGFNGHHFLLSHDIDPSKPWDRKFIREALRGFPPSKTSTFYFQFCEGPVSVYSKGALMRKKAVLQIAKAIGMLWKK